MEKEIKKTKKTDYIYARGSRKTSVSQVRFFKAGSGNITVNGKELKDYFKDAGLMDIVASPLKITGQEKITDLSIKVRGGGIHSQSEACRHGISRALIKFDEQYKPILKAEGFMTRDPRVKERKKPGLKRARRAPQWAKR